MSEIEFLTIVHGLVLVAIVCVSLLMSVPRTGGK